MYRHPDNHNLTLAYGDQWNGLPLLGRQEPFVEQYLEINHRVMRQAFSYGRECLVILLELRFPHAYPCSERGVMTHFFRSLKEQIKADLKARHNRTGRNVSCDLDYVWAREQDSSDRSHFHAALFFDLAAYYTLGNLNVQVPAYDEFQMSPITPAAQSMAGRINRAWARAIGISEEQGVGLVHYPKNAEFRMGCNRGMNFEYEFFDLFRRLSYLTKTRTKDYTQHGVTDWYGSSRVHPAGF